MSNKHKVKNLPAQAGNLKHGYIFLSIFLIVTFTATFLSEMYFKKEFVFALQTEEKQVEGDDKNIEDEKTDEVVEENVETIIDIHNLYDGFTTLEEEITVVGLADPQTQIFIGSENVDIREDGRFEFKVTLIVGENEISVQAIKDEAVTGEKVITVIREEEKMPVNTEESSGDSLSGGGDNRPVVQNDPPQNSPNPEPELPQPTEQPTEIPTPTPIPTQTPTQIPTVSVTPVQSNVTGLSISCSINNTRPSVGAVVGINCTLVDQSGDGVAGAFGYISMNWQSGNTIYTLSQSNSSGTMNAGFSVPSGNSGVVSGTIRASHSGLDVSSNFTLNVN